MNNHGLVKQSRRWVVWATVGLFTLFAAGSPWLAPIAYACQNQGGGC